MSRQLALSLGFVLTLCIAFAASAQPCGHWAGGYAINDLGGRIHASVLFDDGSGEALYVAGEFENDAHPGRRGIAKWNGTAFVPVGAAGGGGGGLNGPAFCLAVFDDDGPGPNAAALFVGGSFDRAGVGNVGGGGGGVSVSNLAKWDGQAWGSPAGGVSGGVVYALREHDDGTGPGLFVGGEFTLAGDAGVGVQSLAVYKDGEWNDVGGGITFFGFGGTVQTLESFGGALYIGGFFDRAGGLAANSLARWDGQQFDTVGDGVSFSGSSAQVTELLAVNLPSTGSVLIVAGTLDRAGGVASGPIARWTGTAWQTMNSGFTTGSTIPGSLCVHDDGTGPALFAGANLSLGAGVSKWNGSAWSLVGSSPATTGVPYGLDTMTSLSGNRLFVGGMFSRIDGVPVPWAATLQSGQWSAFGPFGLGLDGAANAIGVFDLGDGAHLYAAGSFRLAGGIAAAGVARRGPTTGGAWQALATTITPANGVIRCMEVFDSGSGPALYVGGAFSNLGGVAAANVARWRPGTGWSAAGAGLSNQAASTSGTVFALRAHQDPGAPGPSLFATGMFQFSGAAAITNVARFNGTAWSSVGAGAGPNGTTGATLASLDPDGPGGAAARLYFGGAFLPIASWNGAAWSTETAPLSATVVSTLGVFDFGGGAALFAGGDITSPFLGSVAKRSGNAWQNVGASPRFPNNGSSGGNPANGSVMATLPFTDVNGAGLYMTGIFGALNIEGYRNAAYWDGSGWVGVGGGLASRFPGTDGRGTGMVGFDDGTGPAIYFSGKFERFYPDALDTAWHATYNIAKWVPCLPPPACAADFNDDGELNADDLADYINCFFAQPACAAAEFSGDPEINADDLAEYINAFFAGCP